MLTVWGNTTLHYTTLHCPNSIFIFDNLTEPCVAGQFLDEDDGCQPCPADHWSLAGNTEATCTMCPDGKGVDPGIGTDESACQLSELI